MTISNDLQSYIVEKGLLVTAIFIMLYFLSWRIDSRIWVAELSDGEQKGNDKGYYVYLAIFFGALTAILNYFDSELLGINPAISQFSLFIINLLIYSVYILADLLVIDFILYSRFKPKFMELEEVPIKNNPAHHIKYGFRWLIVGAFFCFLASLF